MRTVVEASGEVRFRSQDRRELYAWLNHVKGARLGPAPTGGQGTGAALSGEDERTMPGAGEALDWMLLARRRSAAASLSAASISEKLHDALL